MDRARNFKFGVRAGRRAFKPKNATVGQKECGLRHVTYFYNFGTLSTSLEWVQLETSNLVCGLTVRSTDQKCKSGSKGAWPTSRGLLL